MLASVSASQGLSSCTSSGARRSCCAPAAATRAAPRAPVGPLRSRTPSSPLVASQPLQKQERAASVIPRATDDQEPSTNRNTEFGYSRKDVILIGVGLFAVGYALYYGLQATGMEAGYAGNWVQLIVVLGLCIGWVSTYFFRVATKQTTYVKQLEQYEEAVMRKRLEEMTEAELAEMVGDADAERAAKGAAPKA